MTSGCNNNFVQINIQNTVTAATNLNRNSLRDANPAAIMCWFKWLLHDVHGLAKELRFCFYLSKSLAQIRPIKPQLASNWQSASQNYTAAASCCSCCCSTSSRRVTSGGSERSLACKMPNNYIHLFVQRSVYTWTQKL